MRSRTMHGRRTLAAVVAAASICSGVAAVTTNTTASAAQGAVVAEPNRDPVAYHKHFVTLWNEERWDEIHAFYVADGIIAPPNHELIRGNDAILAFYKTARALLGKMQPGQEPHKTVVTKDLAAVMGNYVFETGVRITSTEVYQRQSDGSWKDVFETFGFRDPLP